MKYYKTLDIYKNSSGTLTVNLKTMKGYSYNRYEILNKFKNKVVLNNYNYSATTIKHYYKVISLLNNNNIKYITLEAPKGLQDLDSAIFYYKQKIADLRLLIDNPKTRRSTNYNRMLLIKGYIEKLELIQDLQKVSKDAIILKN